MRVRVYMYAFVIYVCVCVVCVRPYMLYGINVQLKRAMVKYNSLSQEQCHIKQQCENQYSQQIEKLLSDLQDQWDKHSQLNLQINKQKRTEFELRDELMRKDNHLEDTKKELNDKISEYVNSLFMAIVFHTRVVYELILLLLFLTKILFT